MKSEPRFSVRERVRWNDIDIMGVVWYGAYSRLIEIADTEFFRALGFPYHTMCDEFGIWLVRVHVEFDYRSPAKLDEELDIETRLVKVGGASARFEFTIVEAHERRLVATAGLVVAAVDGKTLKTRALPATLRSALAGALHSAA